MKWIKIKDEEIYIGAFFHGLNMGEAALVLFLFLYLDYGLNKLFLF